MTCVNFLNNNNKMRKKLQVNNNITGEQFLNNGNQMLNGDRC